MLTADQLKKIMPNAGDARRTKAVPILNAVAKAYEINNERRMAAWLATLAVESGELKYQEEIASGAAYEGRRDLGNTQKGDGRRFKGRGRIQITGRTNTTAYTNYLKKSGHLPFVDFLADPDKLAQEPYATDSAGWFWAKFAKLNGFADRGDFLTTQTRVNGRNKKTGLPNHWRERNNYFIKGLSALPDNFSLTDQPSPVVQPAVSASTLPPDTTHTDKSNTEDTASILPTQEQPATSPEPQAVESRESTDILTKASAAGDKVQQVNSTIEKFQLPTVPSGLGTKLLTVGKFALGLFFMAINFVSEHWEYLLVGVVLIVVAGYFWNLSRERNNPVGAIPPPIDPNAKKWWKFW